MSFPQRQTIVLIGAILAAQLPGLLNLPLAANSEDLRDVFQRAFKSSASDCQPTPVDATASRSAVAPTAPVAPPADRVEGTASPHRITPFGMTDAQVAAERAYDRQHRRTAAAPVPAPKLNRLSFTDSEVDAAIARERQQSQQWGTQGQSPNAATQAAAPSTADIDAEIDTAIARDQGQTLAQYRTASRGGY